MPATLLGIQDGGPTTTMTGLTIPANCILVAYSGVVDNAGGNIAAGLTVSGGPGSAWVPKVTVGVAGNFKAQCQLSVSEVVGPGQSGVTLTFAGVSGHISSLQAVWAVTGYDITNPYGGVAQSSVTASGAVSIALDKGPNPQDITLAAIHHDGSPSGTFGVTPGADFSEDGEDGSTGNETFGEAEQRTGPSALVTWVDAQTGTMVVNTTAVAAIVIRMPSTDPYVVDTAAAAISASRSPSLTFAVAPLAGDVIVIWPSSTTTAAITDPSGWVNVLGANTDIETDAHEQCCLYHVVTAAEAAASTVTFTATNLYDVAETGAVVGAVVRNVNIADVLAGFQTADNSGAVTPHLLSAVTPDVSGGLILSAVAKDTSGTYTTQPTDWTFIATSTTQKLLRYNILSTSGVAVGPTNITPSASDEYISITVVLNPSYLPQNRPARTTRSRMASINSVYY